MHDLSLHIMDMIENSLHAHATVISIGIEIDHADDLLVVRVEDDGEGTSVAPELLLDPFYTSRLTKKVGLGLSFFRMAAELAGGKLTMSRSQALGGMAVEARMELTHVDRPPLGDLSATISTMVFMNPHVDFRLAVRSGNQTRHFRVSEFITQKSLDGGANVQLANSVLEALRGELEPWTRSELITWMDRMSFRERASEFSS
jgi:hypothetical protein